MNVLMIIVLRWEVCTFKMATSDLITNIIIANNPSVARIGSVLSSEEKVMCVSVLDPSRHWHICSKTSHIVAF